jgi:hypothetical protein
VEKFPAVITAAAGGVVAGMVFQEPLRRSLRSILKSVVHALNDGYQTVREDLDDLRAETDAERMGPRSATPATPSATPRRSATSTATSR